MATFAAPAFISMAISTTILYTNNSLIVVIPIVCLIFAFTVLSDLFSSLLLPIVWIDPHWQPYLQTTNRSINKLRSMSLLIYMISNQLCSLCYARALSSSTAQSQVMNVPHGWKMTDRFSGFQFEIHLLYCSDNEEVPGNNECSHNFEYAKLIQGKFVCNELHRTFAL